MIIELRRSQFGLLALCMGSATITGTARSVFEPGNDVRLQQLVHEVASGKTDAVVESSIRRVLSRSSDDPEGLWLLGTVLASRGEHARSWACYRRIPSSHPQGLKARLFEGDQLLQLGDASGAEATWRQALVHEHFRIDAQQRLLALFGFQLRRKEWRDAIQTLIEGRRAGLREVVQLIIVPHVVWEGEGIVETLERFVAVNADDYQSRASLVHHLLAAGRSEDARAQLEPLMSSGNREEVSLAVLAVAVADADPALLSSFLKGKDAIAVSRMTNVPAWRRGLGELELIQGRPLVAYEHLMFAAKGEPFHPGGRQQLSLSLRLLNRTSEAALHARAASVLARLNRTCHSMQNSGRWTDERVLLVARDAASIGMIEEAIAWLRFALSEGSKDPRITELLVLAEKEPPTSVADPPDHFLDPAEESYSR